MWLLQLPSLLVAAVESTLTLNPAELIYTIYLRSNARGSQLVKASDSN